MGQCVMDMDVNIVPKKTKKKKSKTESTISCNKNGSPKLKKKSKKCTRKTSSSDIEKCSKIIIAHSENEKDKKQTNLDSDKGEKKKAKKQKKKIENLQKPVQDETKKILDIEDNNLTSISIKKKAKKLKKKKEKGIGDNCSQTSNDTLEDKSQKIKTKKKKVKTTKAAIENVESQIIVENEVVGNKESKKHKKKTSKRSKEYNDETVSIKKEWICEMENNSSTESLKKTKKNNKNLEINDDEIPVKSTKKKKAKKHKIAEKVDNKEVKIPKMKKIKKENARKVKYTTATKKVLGKDAKKSSPYDKEENKVEEPRNLGQWGNIQFNDHSKQDKFLRLMGGKKSSNSNKGKLWSGAKPTFSTSALSLSESSKLNNALEGQFQNALDFHLQKRNENNKSKGLGFSEDPGYGKKFHIDLNKNSSIKFD